MAPKTGHKTHLGKFTQSCNPLVFSQPGISEWTIPGKIEIYNVTKQIPISEWTIPGKVKIKKQTKMINVTTKYLFLQSSIGGLLPKAMPFKCIISL